MFCQINDHHQHLRTDEHKKNWAEGLCFTLHPLVFLCRSQGFEPITALIWWCAGSRVKLRMQLCCVVHQQTTEWIFIYSDDADVGKETLQQEDRATSVAGTVLKAPEDVTSFTNRQSKILIPASLRLSFGGEMRKGLIEMWIGNLSM